MFVVTRKRRCGKMFLRIHLITFMFLRVSNRRRFAWSGFTLPFRCRGTSERILDIDLSLLSFVSLKREGTIFFHVLAVTGITFLCVSNSSRCIGSGLSSLFRGRGTLGRFFSLVFFDVVVGGVVRAEVGGVAVFTATVGVFYLLLLLILTT